MIEPSDLIRGAHLAASVLPAGLYIFALLVARPAGRVPAELWAWSVRTQRWCVPVAFVTGALWVGVEAVTMSGEPLPAAITPKILGAVLGSTLFGHVWIVRALLLAGLGVWVFRPAVRQTQRASDAVGLVLTGGFALTLAWVGHAAGIEGAQGVVLLGSQVVHLAATAGWLGALPPLAAALAVARRRPAAIGFAAAVTRRFSPLGMICVAGLVLSGIVNSWVLVGTIPALVGTAYGHLLLIKLALVLAMLMLAAVNRLWLTPHFDRDARRALRALAATISLETALGLGVLVVVGALGAAAPGAHETPLWPFSFTLSTEPVIVDGRLDPPFTIALMVAVIGLTVAAIGAIRRSWAIAGLAAVAVLFAADNLLRAMEVPATPTMFMASPVAFTAEAVARGGALYAEHCVVCHGPTGHGDGPAAASFPPGEATVVGHLLAHPEGELFWFIGHGIPGTPMPGFAAQVTPEQRWTLIQFLRAQAQATEAAGLGWRVSPTLGVPAPDFAFQIGRGPLETLSSQRGTSAVLLVLYNRPAADARLEQLAVAAGSLAGLRIIAVPLDANDAAGAHPEEMGILAQPAPDIVTAYGLYGWRIGSADNGAGAPQPTEFLIDRSGALRARWHLSESGGWSDLARLKGELDTLAREPFRPPEPAPHVHG